MNIDEEIRIIKLKIDEANKIKTRAEIQRDNARATLDLVVGRLKDEFGVNSLEEAQALKLRFEDSLKEKIEEIKLELKAFE